MDVENSRKRREFFNIWVISSIILFLLNNWFFKEAYGNFLTGKLSDFLFCFFFPLYCSALLSLGTKLQLKARLTIGALVTVLVFGLVKVSNYFSHYLNIVLSYLSEMLGMGPSINIADPYDLIALPFCLVAYYFGVSIGETNNQIAH